MQRVFVDVSWLAHRAAHSMPGLSHGEMATGVIFGFFEQLLHTCADNRVGSNRVALFFDSKKSFRREDHPFYKNARDDSKKTSEQVVEASVMRKQVQILRRQILPDIGFPCYRQSGLESDDLIAQAASQLRGEQAVIITADGDLFQCITETTHWYDPLRNLYLDQPGLFQHKRVSPRDWVEVKCLAGCTTDNVPGIPGVGEKTATDYLWRLLKPGKRLAAIDSPEGRQVVERNRGLISLPHAQTKPLALAEPAYKPDAFFSWCDRLGMRSYAEGSRRRAWENFFSGNINVEARQVAGARMAPARSDHGLLSGRN